MELVIKKKKEILLHQVDNLILNTFYLEKIKLKFPQD